MTDEGDAKIVVTGGTLNAEVIAVGPYSQASKVINEANAELTKKGLDDVRVKLETLMDTITAHADKLADPNAALELTQRVAKELTQSKPDKLTLKGFLTLLAEETKSVAEIVTAALSLKGLVGLL